MNKAVSFSIFVVSGFWNSDRVDPFPFVDLKSCARTTLKKILMTACPLCRRSASQREPFLYFCLSLLISLRHYWTWTTPAENKDSAFSFVCQQPPDWPRITKIRLSVPPCNSLNEALPSRPHEHKGVGYMKPSTNTQQSNFKNNSGLLLLFFTHCTNGISASLRTGLGPDPAVCAGITHHNSVSTFPSKVDISVMYTLRKCLENKKKDTNEIPRGWILMTVLLTFL